MSDILLNDYNIAIKIVSAVDSNLSKFVPIIHLQLDCKDRKEQHKILIFEFTLEEAREFIQKTGSFSCLSTPLSF